MLPGTRLSHRCFLPALIGCGLIACNEDSNNEHEDDPPLVIEHRLRVDGATLTGQLRPLWGDHYDLSFQHFDYPGEAGFSAVLASLEPRSWRCSIGRWEVGFPPPAGGDSLDPGTLAMVEREYYRGPNTLVGADDPANYDFTYLDALLAGLVAEGAEPYLCFDYMPFSLSSEQDPNNGDNYNLLAPGTPYSSFSFSNGIRTAPPADPLVYARVVRNTVRHVRGLFAGAADFGIEWIEIGNEPDLVNPAGQPTPYFWTGDSSQFIDMYNAIAAEIEGDVQLDPLIRLGAGSFAFLPTVAGAVYLQAMVADVVAQGTRFDFLSFHSYGDDLADHLGKFLVVQSITGSAGLSASWVNAEWGRALNGTEPAYDQIEHGLLRGKVLAAMQLFPFELAHEALYRDPGTSGGELGLTRTEPPAHKPVSRLYQGLMRLNGTLEALEVVDNPSELVLLAGRDVAGTRLHVAVLVDSPASGNETRLTLQVDNLPWGAGDYTLERLRVTQAGSESGAGVESFSSATRNGGSLVVETTIVAGAGGLYLFELSAL